MFPVKLFLNYIFDFSTNFALTATVTRLETSSVNILCDSNGIIDGVSKNFYEALGLNAYAIHSYLLHRGNILLFIPRLFEQKNIKEIERLMSEKDHYADVLVNERLEILIPNDFRAYIDGFDAAPSTRTMRTKWKNKKFLKHIENYVIEVERESRLSRKMIIVNLKFRNLSTELSQKKMFYYIEITEIYSENATSTFMTHNTFAVSLSRNETSKDEFVAKLNSNNEIKAKANQQSRSLQASEEFKNDIGTIDHLTNVNKENFKSLSHDVRTSGVSEAG